MNAPDSPSLDSRLARFPVKRAGDRLPAYREAQAAHGHHLPLVLLHGIGSGSGSFVMQLEELGDKRRVIAWDAPGYGESPQLPMADPTAADYAGELARLLEALAIPRMVLVGHSLGALMAGAYAVTYPSRVAGLVLMNPAGGYGSADASVRAEKLRARLAMMDELGPEGLAQKRGGNLVSPAASDEARQWVIRNMSRLHPPGHAQAARMLASGRLAEDLAKFRGPVLMIGSSGDTVTPEAGCRRIAAANPSVRYVSLSGPGHASYVEAPRAVNELIESFAEDVE